MPPIVQFFGWHRSGVYDLVADAGLNDGRLEGEIALTMQERDPASDAVRDTRSGEIQFLIQGPRDVQGLERTAVRQAYPPPGSLGAEPTFCAHVELAALDLPWRYTPELVDEAPLDPDPVVAADRARRLRPWLVLLVGTTAEMTLLPRGQVEVGQAVLADHDLTRSARWAHMQDDGSRRITRLLSPRVLQPLTTYVAAIVPAFDPTGTDRWQAGALPASLVLPRYFDWHFTTGKAGDFRSLAAQLKPQRASEAMGRAPLSYERLAPPVQSEVRGALAPIGGTDAALPPEVAADLLNLLSLSPVDPEGRPVTSMPRYGAAFVPDPLTPGWGEEANTDPRHRGVCGLGLWCGIELQERIAAEAAEQAGDLAMAAQRLRHLGLGVEAAGGLWRRRLPVDSSTRLMLYGAAMDRMPTTGGSVLDQVTAPERPLPRSLFSSAARRVLRGGPARTRLAQAGANAPSRVLGVANRCPPPPRKDLQALPHADKPAAAAGLGDLDDLIAKILDSRTFPKLGLRERIIEVIEAIRNDPRFSRAARALVAFLEEMLKRIDVGEPIPCLALIRMLVPVDLKEGEIDIGRMLEEFEQIDREPDHEDLLALLEDLHLPPDRPRCRPVDLGRLEEVVTGAIDPTTERAFMVVRVLDTIDGIDDPLPPEICIELDIAAWTFLRDYAPEWLLPRIGELKENAVIALEANPVFNDAFLLGLNTQVIGELRFRNIPIPTGCTPARRIWGRVRRGGLRREDDIEPIGRWAASSPLGDASHAPGGNDARDLVMVFKSELFRRYPDTVVSLQPAQESGGAPDWEVDPDPDPTRRILPTFMGRIGEDLTFFGFDVAPEDARDHWVVLEEPSTGTRFRNALGPNVDAGRRARFEQALSGADFAAAAVARLTVVCLRGDVMIPDLANGP